MATVFLWYNIFVAYLVLCHTGTNTSGFGAEVFIKAKQVVFLQKLMNKQTYQSHMKVDSIRLFNILNLITLLKNDSYQ